MADKPIRLFLNILRLRWATVCAMYDPLYKRLFAFSRMVADLLRAIGEPGWIDDIDFGTHGQWGGALAPHAANRSTVSLTRKSWLWVLPPEASRASAAEGSVDCACDPPLGAHRVEGVCKAAFADVKTHSNPLLQ